MKPYCEETFLYIGLFAFLTWLVRQTNEDDEALALDHQFYMLHGHFAYYIQLLSFNEFSDLKTTLICSNQKQLNTHDISWYFITSVLCFSTPDITPYTEGASCWFCRATAPNWTPLLLTSGWNLSHPNWTASPPDCSETIFETTT